MPAPKSEFHPDASAEAEAAAAWYAQHSEDAAHHFLAELDFAVEQVASAPERWPRFGRGARRVLFRRFPYSLVYRVTDAVIEVLAVAHAKRKPGYWKRRWGRRSS